MNFCEAVRLFDYRKDYVTCESWRIGNRDFWALSQTDREPHLKAAHYLVRNRVARPSGASASIETRDFDKQWYKYVPFTGKLLDYTGDGYDD
jgi:hypothetical protein